MKGLEFKKYCDVSEPSPDGPIVQVSVLAYVPETATETGDTP